MAGIEQEANKENDTKDNGEDGPDGIRDIINGVLNSPDLGKSWPRRHK